MADVLKRADLALYIAKDIPGSSHAFHTPALAAHMIGQMRVEQEIAGGLRSGEFFLEYQPIVDAGHRGYNAFEALVRWRHPGRGVLTPDQFLPIAERSGHIMALGRFVVAQAIRDVAVSLDPLVIEAGLTLSVPPEDARYEAPMDVARIERVLFNLLHNAIKFSRDGGTITVTARDEGDSLRCEVRDEGMGIPPEQLPRLFQRFSQLQEGSAKGGTGLGLSIAKAIVEAHGGAIGVESARGEGSTFWFTLPTKAITR